jgi:fucose 4-O-acetylase-like acetyltransferase
MHFKVDMSVINKTRRRLLDIDRAKGLAIILVVIGHVSDTGPIGNEWYDMLKHLLYSFHMAFFIFLSGYVMYISYLSLQSFNSLVKYISKRFERLMVPFLFFSLLIFVGKNVAQLLIIVNNPIVSPSDFLAVLLYPTDSIARSLWYIYVLFIFSMSFPFLMIVSRNRIEYWLALGIILSLMSSFVSISHFVALHQICAYFVFILTGAIAAKQQDLYLANIDKWGWAWVSLFGISLFFTYHHTSIPLLVTGMISIPALHTLIRKNPLAKADLLLTLGTFVFPIYLMNTIFMGSIRGMILQFVSWDYWHFLIICPILIIAGLAGPVLIYRAVGHRARIFSILLGGPR